MSLLMNYTDQNYVELAQLIFQEQFKRDPKLESEMTERRKRLMYDDVVYNISFLMTAVHFQDVKIFEHYAKWIYELLCNLMKDLDRDRIMEHMTVHYQVMADLLQSHGHTVLAPDELLLAIQYLERAATVTREAVTDIVLSTEFQDGLYYDYRKGYLDALLKSDVKKASQLIHEARQQQIPIIDIYEFILAKVMHEIGSLWHRNIITVDKEHFATTVTQTILSSFYDEILSRPGKNRTLVSCAVGSELHEMGIRMLSDLFEYYGLDTYYLGAALPEAAILKALEDQHPDLVALSVTMPQYLVDCERIVKSIRHQYPDLKIAVGGQAFNQTQALWEQWAVDFHANSAIDLVKWASQFFADKQA